MARDELPRDLGGSEDDLFARDRRDRQSVFFDREAAAFVNSLRTGAPSNVPAKQAHNINLILEALFTSSSQGGAEVRL